MEEKQTENSQFDMERLQALGEAIETLRKDRKITQDDLFKLGGISTNSLYRLTTGKSDVLVQSIYKTADVLGIDVAELFYEADNKTKQAILRRVFLDMARGNIISSEIETALLGVKPYKKYFVGVLLKIINFLQ